MDLIECTKCKKTENIRLRTKEHLNIEGVFLSCESCGSEIDVSENPNIDKAWSVAKFYHEILADALVQNEEPSLKRIGEIERRIIGEYLWEPRKTIKKKAIRR